jgi:hypothetical protein
MDLGTGRSNSFRMWFLLNCSRTGSIVRRRIRATLRFRFVEPAQVSGQHRLRRVRKDELPMFGREVLMT